MPGIGELFIRLGLNTDALKNAGAQVEKALAPTAARMANIGSQLSLKLTAPLALIGKQALDTAVRFDSMRRGLIAVTGSAEEADRQIRRLREVAKLPGLSFEDAVKGAISLQAVGFSSDLAERSLRAFGNALATVGKGAADLDGVNLALTQIISKGKVSAEELNQLAERVPQVRKAVEAAFGTADTEALQRSGVSAEQFVRGIVTELEKLPPVTGGIQNSLENAQQSVQDGFRAIGQAIIPVAEQILSTVVPAIEATTAAFQRLSPQVQNAIVVTGLVAAALGPVAFIVSKLTGVVTVMITTFAKLRVVFSAIAALVSVKVALIVGAVALLAGAAVLVVRNWDSIATFFARLWDNVRTIFTTSIGLLVESVRGLFLNAVAASIQGAAKLLGVFQLIAAGLKDTTLTSLIGNLQSGLTNLIPADAIAENRARLGQLGSEFVGAFDDIKSQGLETAGNMAAGFVSAIDTVKSKARGLTNIFGGGAPAANPEIDTSLAPTGESSAGTGGRVAAGRALNPYGLDVGLRKFTEGIGKPIELPVTLPDTSRAATSLDELNELQRRVTADGVALQDQLNLSSEAGRTAFDILTNSINAASQAIGETFVRLVTFQGGFEGMQQTIRDFGRAMRDILRQVIADLIAAIAKAAILKGLLSLTGFGAAGTGGIFGSALRSLAGVRAKGGPVEDGKTYLVGERGPELFTPQRDGEIIPNNKIGNALAPARRAIAGVRAMGGTVQTGLSYLVGERGPELFTSGRQNGRIALAGSGLGPGHESVDLNIRAFRVGGDALALTVDDSRGKSRRRFGVD